MWLLLVVLLVLLIGLGTLLEVALWTLVVAAGVIAALVVLARRVL